VSILQTTYAMKATHKNGSYRPGQCNTDYIHSGTPFNVFQFKVFLHLAFNFTHTRTHAHTPSSCDIFCHFISKHTVKKYLKRLPFHTLKVLKSFYIY
jgi:hypothetical protein